MLIYYTHYQELMKPVGSRAAHHCYFVMMKGDGSDTL
jgi:hypothetical protein